jgi:hypothetical protein
MRKIAYICNRFINIIPKYKEWPVCKYLCHNAPLPWNFFNDLFQLLDFFSFLWCSICTDISGLLFSLC